MHKNSKLKSALLLMLLSVSLLCACKVENKTFTYSIRGQLIDNVSQSSFNNKTIEAYNTYTARGNEYLGKCIINNNGEFELRYELSNALSGNYLKLYFADSNFTAESKFESMPIGESWTKIFYVGDSASVDVWLNENLNANDTLYLNTSNTSQFIGPTVNKHLGKIRVLNSGNIREYIYAKGLNNFLHKKSAITISPTGDPIVDTLLLNIEN